MPTIYELTKEANDLLNLIEFAESPEEVELLEQKLAQNGKSAEQKIKFLTSVMLELKSTADARDDVIKRLQQRQKTTNNNIERLRELILTTMQTFDIDTVETPLFKVSKQKNQPSVYFGEWFSVDRLPSNIVRVIPEKKEIDKVAAAKYLKERFNGNEQYLNCFNDDLQIGLIRTESIRVR